LATDERTARIALAVLIAPDDPVTGRLLGDVGAVETVRLLTTHGPVPTMDRTAAALWRKHVPSASSPDAVLAALRATEKLGYQTLIPGDDGFPAPLHDLGDRLPYVLWAKGAASLLTGQVHDRFTITGARAATSYGIHVAQALANDLASEEKVLISGGAYGIDGAAHSAILASVPGRASRAAGTYR
jgi:DNA processing protein